MSNFWEIAVNRKAKRNVSYIVYLQVKLTRRFTVCLSSGLSSGKDVLVSFSAKKKGDSLPCLLPRPFKFFCCVSCSPFCSNPRLVSLQNLRPPILTVTESDNTTRTPRAHFWCLYAVRTTGFMDAELRASAMNGICQSVYFTYDHNDCQSFRASETDGGSSLIPTASVWRIVGASQTMPKLLLALPSTLVTSARR